MGVVVVGTSIDTLTEYFKRTSFANIILYDLNGEAYATTFPATDDPFFLSGLSIAPEIVDDIRAETDVVTGENVELNVDAREYRLARGVMRVSGSELGVFAVALPLQFVLEPGSDSRDTYVALFGIAMLFVVGGVYDRAFDH